MDSELETWRLFVAIELPESVRQPLAKAQAGMRQTLASLPIKWVPPGQFHLTLRFLGSVAASRVSALSAVLESVAARFAPIGMQTSGLGFFPGPTRPRVIWAGLVDPAGTLAQLAEAVGLGVSAFTAEPEMERFHAHLTFGRIRGLNRPQVQMLEQSAATAQMPLEVWCAEDLVLMRSQLSSHGAEYSVVSRHRFGAPCDDFRL